jgi:SAM-dependent methyltransferase
MIQKDTNKERRRIKNIPRIVESRIISLLRTLLKRAFYFDAWHCIPLKERPYAYDIINYCNARINRKAFVEIGCGLGDIIRGVRFSQRIGYDIDKNVLAAAKFVSILQFKIQIDFCLLNFPREYPGGKQDVIVLVNWIHHIPPTILNGAIRKLFTCNLNDNGEIIVDTVQNPQYKFNHQIGSLSNIEHSSVTKIGNYENNREVWAIRKCITQ